MGKLLIAYSSMLIGFAVCFYIIFGKQSQFQSFLRTLVKVLVMMTGELEFNDLFQGLDKNSTETHYFYSFLAFSVSGAHEPACC